MLAGQKFLGLMQQIGKDMNPDSQKAALLYATVESIQPISILIAGNPEPITSEFIEVGALCRKYVIPQPHIHNDVPPDTSLTKEETEEIVLWRGLKRGDRVIVIKLNSGQMYYIMQRVEMEGFRE
ncbi:MAG: DUF2577 family protein [Anaerovoracaceae bacterium]